MQDPGHARPSVVLGPASRVKCYLAEFTNRKVAAHVLILSLSAWPQAQAVQTLSSYQRSNEMDYGSKAKLLRTCIPVNFSQVKLGFSVPTLYMALFLN